MKRRQVLGLCALLALAGLLLAYLGQGADPGPQDGAQAGARAVPEVGSPGSFFSAALGQVAPQAAPAPAQAPPPAQDDALRLWPHLRQGEPSAAHQAEVQAQWSRLAQQHPDNVYLPAQYQAPLTAQQARAARARLDDTTAVATRLAAQQHAQRYASPGQEPLEPPAAPANPAQQRQYFDDKIRELESRLQLLAFYLASGQPSASKRAIAAKDMEQWNKELEALRQARAAVPAS
ncbi:MAG: hypothetical protein ACT4NV_16295 [Rhodoferax sp.]